METAAFLFLRVCGGLSNKKPWLGKGWKLSKGDLVSEKSKCHGLTGSQQDCHLSLPTISSGHHFITDAFRNPSCLHQNRTDLFKVR